MEAIPAPGLGSGERVGNRPGGRAVSLFLWCSGPQIPSFLTQEGYPQLQLHPSSSVRMEMTGTAVACCCCCHSPGAWSTCCLDVGAHLPPALPTYLTTVPTPNAGSPGTSFQERRSALGFLLPSASLEMLSAAIYLSPEQAIHLRKGDACPDPQSCNSVISIYTIHNPKHPYLGHKKWFL